jgi:DNA processing protein
MTEADYYLGFSLSSTIGPKRFLSLLLYFQTAEKAWHGTRDEYESIGITGKYFEKFNNFRSQFPDLLKEKKDTLRQKEISFISQVDTLYPKEFLDLERPPIGIFCKGHTEILMSEKKIAIVGSRRITSYGQQITELFALALGAADFTIVSGMALGVDAIAHDSALKSGSNTIAVLGNGVDIPYPRENSDLYHRILDSGGLVLSEYPPGMHALKGSFIARNRLIAALSFGVLVTEAGIKSGSLVTADEAKKLKKDIFAIPGQINSQQFEGISHLLKNGAFLVTDPKDIFEKLGDTSFIENFVEIPHLDLDESSISLLKILAQEPLHRNELCKKIMLPISEVSQIISRLELKGYIKDDGWGKLHLTANIHP